ncbi:diguanylate cyclase domain-containing protein [Collinsella aerofaciens]|uniref:diguanylate cyclase domain-containing protein n=1 Tax=Collinsella aerofaciens TaxID=74426 RepID=UPI00321BB9DF
MNESYRLGEQSIIAYLQRLANGVSTAELDVSALPAELRAVGEQLQKTHAILQQERQLLECNAYIDQLTNLGNRGGLDRHVEQLWRKGDPFTCAYIDIDHLKHCNDRFGHAEGNRYILGICRALTEAMEYDEVLFRIGGDEFVLVSPTTGEAELEQRLERTRTNLVEATSDGKAPMIASFSFGCSRVNPLAGDTRRQMTMDADRKMYRYKLMHRVQQPKDNDAPPHPIAEQLPCNDRVFQAISMSSETRYPFILNLDTGESQWSVNAVRDFDLPSQHPFNSLDLWLARVHPEDRDNVRAELDMVINGAWHFHYMQYRVMDATEAYVLCDCTGYRLDGTDTEPNMYVGMIINRSLADTTDSVTGLGDIHALVNAIGEMRRVARKAGLVAIKIDDIAQVNARFGFDAGDRVLAESAACLMDCSRGKGRLFRSTGPMFVALFDEFDPEETDAIAEEIERFLGSPVLFGSFEYQPPLRVATLHLDAVDRQPVSILNELKALLEEAPQVPGTKLD